MTAAETPGWTDRFLRGLAQHLDDAGIGAWRDTGAYLDGEVAITLRRIPPIPDRVITLAPYTMPGVAAGLADYTVGIQVRCRGTEDAMSADNLADAVFDLLDSCGPLILGAGDDQVHLVDITRRSHTSLSTDPAGRWETSSNYQVEAMRATANRTD